MNIPDKIDPTNRDTVLWLQLALAALMPGPAAVDHIGAITPITNKNIRSFQRIHSLPMTGTPDLATLAKIKQELLDRGITI